MWKTIHICTLDTCCTFCCKHKSNLLPMHLLHAGNYGFPHAAPTILHPQVSVHTYTTYLLSFHFGHFNILCNYIELFSVAVGNQNPTTFILILRSISLCNYFHAEVLFDSLVL